MTMRPNNEMQRTSHGQDGGSPLNSVLSGRSSIRWRNAMTKGVIAALLVAGCSIGIALAAEGTPASSNPPAVDKAKALFKKYIDLEHAFDPAVADLYSDDAVIKNKRTYPTGQVREVTFPAPQYKELVRQAMPLAKKVGDTSTYSDCKYSAEAERVRVTCTRYSERKKYSSPVSLLVGPAPKGEWLIFEELSESQP
jgi:hypothetical protein